MRNHERHLTASTARRGLALCAVLVLFVSAAGLLSGCDAGGAAEDAKEIARDVAENRSILKSPEDIGLHDTDGYETNYAFTYGDQEFTAEYTYDNWRVYDSWRITNGKDLEIICQALLDEHTVHGSDLESIRTAEDMAFEWQQHNIAYAVLPEDNAWREHAKDVDLDPADQGRTFEEIYEDRTGEEIDYGDFDLEELSEKIEELDLSRFLQQD